MAKSKKRKGTHRRRRMGAAGGVTQILMKVGGIGLGVWGGSFLEKTFTSISPTLMGAGEAGIGAMLPRFVKNNALVDGIGDGLMARGIGKLLVSTGVMTGLGAVPLINPYGLPKPGVVVLPNLGGVSQQTTEMIKVGALYSN